MPPAGKLASDTHRPRQYADRTVSSAVRPPSAYAQPSSPTEWPTIPSGSIPNVRSTSTRATWQIQNRQHAASNTSLLCGNSNKILSSYSKIELVLCKEWQMQINITNFKKICHKSNYYYYYYYYYKWQIYPAVSEASRTGYKNYNVNTQTGPRKADTGRISGRLIQNIIIQWHCRYVMWYVNSKRLYSKSENKPTF